MTQDAPTEGMQSSQFVDVYNPHGEVQTVPRHYLGHPVLGKGFSLEPPPSEDVPSASWNRDDLIGHAVKHGVDLSGYGGDKATKAQILAAIAGEPDPNQPPA